MSSPFFLSFLFYLLLLFSLATCQMKTYIVHVVPPKGMADFPSFKDRMEWYHSFLPTGLSTIRESRYVYFYKSIVSGFAIKLRKSELDMLRKKNGFAFAYPDYTVPLATTHSPSYLGLHHDTIGSWNQSEYGKGIIVGVLDTGIWPDHPSFNDEGMPSPPSKWKGKCEFNATQCNNKLIGARSIASSYQNSGSKSSSGPYDEDGHGTHTASTAAGMFVENAYINGLANGTASGVAPYAHLAIYKVCTSAGCTISDVLAGMDQAIEDGVDIMSISLGGSSVPFYMDGIAIGAMSAIEKGIFVSCAGGNSGPDFTSLSNEAPWILTVGASTMDRQLRSVVKLGSGDQFNGESAYQPDDDVPEDVPLVYPGTVAGVCDYGSLDGFDVEGKVVMCDYGDISSVTKGKVVKAAGGAGIIIANGKDQGATIFAEPHVLPASHVSYTDGVTIKAYINSSRKPETSFLFNHTVLGTIPAPALASFSSRGPSNADANILKPDIIGPGVNILAAWPTPIGSSEVQNGAYFDMISGTSMSTPHLSGVAALLKNRHPDWSPAMIKSAMMTTADVKDNNGSLITDETTNPANFFGVGSGHVNPVKADNPGLVYDIKPEEYLAYLCGLDYTNYQVSVIARRSVRCSEMGTGSTSPSNLNLPSLMVFLTQQNRYTMQLNRTVTNVGAADSTYRVQIDAPVDVTVDVAPDILAFKSVNESATFTVTLSTSNKASEYRQGYLAWLSSASHNITVTSPLMVAVDV